MKDLTSEQLVCDFIEACALQLSPLNNGSASSQYITVEFDSYDEESLKVYYNGLGNQHGHTYYIERGVWYLKSMGMNLGTPLKSGLNIVIYKGKAVVCRTSIKDYAIAISRQQE
jgi:hypothetical protein